MRPWCWRTGLLASLAGWGLLGCPVVADANPLPAGLPRYDLAIDLDTTAHRVTVREVVTWTNQSHLPTNELIFNVYPHYKLPEHDYGKVAKTVELLRLNPRFAIDPIGHRGQVQQVSLLSPDGKVQDLPFSYQPDNLCGLVVPLPQPVAPGQSVQVALQYRLELPPHQGRWGQWPVDRDTQAVTPRTITMLSHWLPTLAYYDDAGWHPTPFVPWHQPFFNEAGVYTARIRHTTDQKLACSASFREERDLGQGWHEVETHPFVGRDFALLACAAYQRYSTTITLPDGRPVTVQCLAYPEHAFYANEIVRITAEAIDAYSKWFAPYPYDQFTTAEAFFGWNGNECSGLIMIDERVFTMPKLAVGYVEYLVSHETCHQWWYNRVGNNGYAETFIDEGFTTYLTHRWMDRKLGRNNKMLQWPERLNWLPNIERENYRYSSYVGHLRRGESTPAVQTLPEFGHILNLFSGAYDRGSKIVGMIESRLGEAAFIEFLRKLQKKYAFRILNVKQLQLELEAFTGQSWQAFFDEWIYSAGLSDWQVKEVDIERPGPMTGAYRTVVRVQQTGEILEPTMVGFRLDDGSGYQVRLPLLPIDSRQEFDQPPAVVQPLGPDTWQVEVLLPSKPTQVSVDPDQVLIDSDPANNHWHTPWNIRATPFYTLLDETDLTTDYDKWNVIVGPWLYGGTTMNFDPWYTRDTMLGVRAAVTRTQQFNSGAFLAFRSDIRDFVVGVDGLIDHWPHRYTQFGYHVEQRIAGPIGNDAPNDVTRAALFGRYIFNYGPSLYLPPIEYLEGYTAFQDNPLPFRETITDGVRPDRYFTGGVHYRVNYLTPYWHPEAGFRFDISYSGGLVNFDAWQGYHALQSNLIYAKKLPDHWGPLSDTVMAMQINGAVAFPDKGEYFALGGSQLFRGFDLAERHGSAYWVVNLEARHPILRNCKAGVLDRSLSVENVYLALFYDVGEIFVNSDPVRGVAHAVGTGIRLDTALFSLIERVTLRLDVAKTLNEASPWQFWLGVQHPF